MAKTFSNEQLSAINTRDRTLLVSAAAGSGKTTTLTERIIRSLLDEKKPESLENMLENGLLYSTQHGRVFG